jgi:hypothetical protein
MDASLSPLSPARLRKTTASPESHPASDDDERRAKSKRTADEERGRASPYRKGARPGASGRVASADIEAPDPSMHAGNYVGGLQDPLSIKRLKKLKTVFDFGNAQAVEELARSTQRVAELWEHSQQLKSKLQRASRAPDGVAPDSSPVEEEELETEQVRTLRVEIAAINTAMKAEREKVQALEDRIERHQATSDPGMLLESMHSPDTVAKWRAYVVAWVAEQNYYSVSSERGFHTKHLWNLASGLGGYWLCFGPGVVVGTLYGPAAGAAVASATGVPLLGYGVEIFLGPAVSTISWTLCEPLLAMIRATSWSSPELEGYGELERLRARAAREWIDGSADLPRNRKFEFTEPGSGTRLRLNAADYLAHKGSSLTALYAGKMGDTDLPYGVYAVANSVRNSLPDLLGNPDLYQPLAWNLGSRLVAGTFAGPLTAEAIQLLRQFWQKGIESVTMSRATWALLAAYLQSLIKDCDDKIGKEREPVRKERLAQARDALQPMLYKARQKSGWLSSISYEVQTLWQRKREAVGVDAEAPGKRLNTIASGIGKFVCQAPGALASGLAKPFVAAGGGWRVAANIVAPSVQIFCGFIFRREAEFHARVAFGAMAGLRNRIRRCCRAEEDG